MPTNWRGVRGGAGKRSVAAGWCVQGIEAGPRAQTYDDYRRTVWVARRHDAIGINGNQVVPFALTLARRLNPFRPWFRQAVLSLAFGGPSRCDGKPRYSLGPKSLSRLPSLPTSRQNKNAALSRGVFVTQR